MVNPMLFNIMTDLTLNQLILLNFTLLYYITLGLNHIAALNLFKIHK